MDRRDFVQSAVTGALATAAASAQAVKSASNMIGIEDGWGPNVPNIARAQEKRFDGTNATTLCFNNPNYRNWLLGAVEDYARSYEIDGIMWGSERQGAFANALGASHGGGGGGAARTT